jgi:hypothetical protein
MSIVFDFNEAQWFFDVMDRRRTFVQDVVEEGTQQAEAYAEAGGRHRTVKGRYLRRPGRRILRVRHATAAQKCRMIEHAAYRHFIDWWGDW